jgi:hypothetical protein
MNAENIFKEVETRLRQATGPSSIAFTELPVKFQVLEELSHQDHEALWHVFVASNVPRESKGVWYDLLRRVEREIADELSVEVMLVPVKGTDMSQCNTSST